MAKCLVGAAGGLSAADKAKLIPENIRAGVTLFKGTPKEVVGTLTLYDFLPETVPLFDGTEIHPMIGSMVPYSGGSEIPYIRGGKIVFNRPVGPSETYVEGVYASEYAFNADEFDELTISWGGSITWKRPQSVGYIDATGNFVKLQTHSADGGFTDTLVIQLSNLSSLIRPAISVSTGSPSETQPAYISKMTLLKNK